MEKKFNPVKLTARWVVPALFWGVLHLEASWLLQAFRAWVDPLVLLPLAGAYLFGGFALFALSFLVFISKANGYDFNGGEHAGASVE